MHPTRLYPIAFFACFAALIPQPAFAYIDPGLGSLIFQSAVAIFVTVAAGWATLRMKLRHLLSRFTGGAGENAPK
ncbi:MAG: hypothetical protein WC829_07270 [Hyphomicrobium sp.]|jgi:hypothetical protein